MKRKEKVKVYCVDCEHLRPHLSIDELVDNVESFYSMGLKLGVCMEKSNIIKEDTPFREVIRHKKTVEELNKNNDCCKFKIKQDLLTE